MKHGIDAARDLVVELERLGVQMWAEGGQLRFRAPKGVLNPALLAQLKAHKPALLSYLDAAAGEIIADPAARHEPFPLTEVQSAYLLGRNDAFAYGGLACHGYFELAFSELEPAALESAWRRLVERHDMLRAVISLDGHQRVLADPPPYRIQVTDLRDARPAQVEAALAAIRAELSHKVYDAQQWPLFTLHVTRTPQRDLLHVSIDLLIADYASIQLLLAELDALYLHPDAPLPHLDISFRDHLLAERAARQSPAYESDRRWWEARLDDLPPGPELPVLDRPEATPRFQRWQATLDTVQWATLRQQAADRKLTATGALLAAYAEVIGRWSRQPRFTLNLTLLNRPPLHPQVAALVGDFTSVTLLAVEPAPAAEAGAPPPSFAARAAKLQEQLWQDLDHRRFSGVEVLREVARRRGAGAALLPVVFTSTIGVADEPGDTGGLASRGELVYGISQTPQVWIDCQVMEHRGQLQINWDVRAGVFPDGLVDAMFRAYTELIERLAAGDDAWQVHGPVPLPADQVQRRAAVNATTMALPVTLLHSPVLAQAARTPDRVAVLADGRVLTYRELVERAAAVAAWLRASGVRPAEPVAVVMEKGWEQVVGVLGVLLADGVYVPIDTNQPPLRCTAMLTAAEVRFVLSQSWLELEHPAVLAVDQLPAQPVPAAPLPSTATPDDLAYIIFTSGSTGVPKGVMVTHRAAGNTVADINQRFAVGADDRVLGLANLGFDLSVYDIFGPLAVGGTLVLPDASRRNDPSHWADLVAEHGVTLWNSVPAQLQMLHDYLAATPQVALASLRLALVSGDWIPVPLPDAIRDRIPGLRMISLGGATEAAIWSIHYEIAEVAPEWSSIPYGFPLANQSFHVLDADLQACPDWVTGELYIGGVGLAQGYLGDEVRTRERFIIHPDNGERLYRTGDLGRYLADGAIEFLGRDDAQVKIRGHRIELAEVNAALSSHPDIGAAVTLVEGSKPADRRLVAFVEPQYRPDSPAVVATMARVAAAADTAGSDSTLDGAALVAAAVALDRAALNAMLAALRANGLFTTAETVHDLDEVLTAARVAPRHHRLVRRWLRALTDEGLLCAQARGWRLADAAPTGIDADWDRVQELAATHGYGTELVGYLRASSERLPELLRDELDPLALLFPEGRLDVAQAAYQDNVISRYLNERLAVALRTIATEHPAGRHLSVLEVGAGVGGTTTDLISALDGQAVDYLFTDVSAFFLDAARQRFADSAWVRYGLFDLNRDHRAQGLQPHSFDVVVCANVLHNARHAGEVLGRLTELIRPGGWLLFIEATRDNYPLMASMEFKEGLTDFTDERLTADRTFHTRAAWQQMLDQLGAELVFCLPGDDHPLAAVGQHAFAARVKPHRAPVDHADLYAHLASRIPDYMLPAAIHPVDALPLTDNGKVDRGKLAGWLTGATREVTGDARTEPQNDLERRLAALWADLLCVGQVARDADFYALGGDSLLLSKLVGQIRDQVPEAAGHSWDVLLRQMLRTPTVAGLATWLTQTAAAPAADASVRPVASPLVLLGAGTGRSAPTRVLVHDGSGTLSPYRALIPALADGGPLIGFTVSDVDGYLGYDAEVLIARLAADYVRELTAAGHEEFEVVGYCLGGLLATEMARQLTEAGAEVRQLTVISSYRVPYQVEDDLLVEYAFARLLGVDPAVLGYPTDEAVLGRALGSVLAESPDLLPAGSFTRVGGDAALNDVAQRFRDLAARSAAQRLAAITDAVGDRFGDDGSIERILRVFRHGLAAVTRHHADPYAGDITFLRQQGELHFLPGLRTDMTDYWRQVCLGDLRVVDIHGDHFNCLAPPHVANVAAVLGGGSERR